MQLGSVGRGDLVEVDMRGRRFMAQVEERDGRELAIKPCSPRHTERRCKSTQVVGIWRATTATRRAKGLTA
jgi:hypothetical protein